MGAGENAIFSLLIEIFSAGKNSLIVVDEIELGLHEEAQKRLIYELKKICAKLHCQIICSTHSAKIIDALPPEGRFFIESGDKACVLLTQKRQGKDYEFEIEVPIVVDSDMLFEDSRPTYANIKKYVFDKYGVRLQQRDIAVVKRDCGIKIKVNKHLIEGDEPVIRKCTPDKRKYIIEALKYYHAI